MGSAFTKLRTKTKWAGHDPPGQKASCSAPSNCVLRGSHLSNGRGSPSGLRSFLVLTSQVLLTAQASDLPVPSPLMPVKAQKWSLYIRAIVAGSPGAWARLLLRLQGPIKERV